MSSACLISTCMGYAAALAWILAVIIIYSTMIQFRLSSRWVYYTGA
jgi:ABC-type sugar transport system permease subunit